MLGEALDRLCDAVPPGGGVVDLGCGPGHDLDRLTSRGLTAVGVDLSLGMLRRAAARAPGRLVAGDLRALPLRDGSCHGVWSSYALLHLSDDDLGVALAQVHRVLRPSGTAVLVLASAGGGCEQVAYVSDQSRVFFARSAELVAELCRSAGLTVLAVDTDEHGWRAPVRVVAQRPAK